jgi:hypothetical protein
MNEDYADYRIQFLSDFCTHMMKENIFLNPLVCSDKAIFKLIASFKRHNYV